MSRMSHSNSRAIALVVAPTKVQASDCAGITQSIMVSSWMTQPFPFRKSLRRESLKTDFRAEKIQKDLQLMHPKLEMQYPAGGRSFIQSLEYIGASAGAGSGFALHTRAFAQSLLTLLICGSLQSWTVTCACLHHFCFETQLLELCPETNQDN